MPTYECKKIEFVHLKKRAPFRGSMFCGKVAEERGRHACLASGREQGRAVLVEHPQPRGHIRRMITARLIGYPKVSAQISCAEFGDQLLHRVCIVTKAIPQIAGQAMTCAAPVGQLMEDDGIIRLGCRVGLRAKEMLRVR